MGSNPRPVALSVTLKKTEKPRFKSFVPLHPISPSCSQLFGLRHLSGLLARELSPRLLLLPRLEPLLQT